MRNASGVNQFKAVDQNGNNGMLFKVKDNSEFSVNVWKDNAFGNEKILATKDEITYEEKSFTISFDAGIKGMKIGENMKDGYMPVSIQPVSLPRSTTTVYSFTINSSGEIWAMINSNYREENVTIKLGFLWMKK